MPVPSEDVSITSVRVCSGARCADRCDPQRECVVTMTSTQGDEANPIFYRNINGGELADWAATPVTEWDEDIDDHLCLGSFVALVSGGEASATTGLLRSDDNGVTRVALGHADFVANPPRCIAGLDRTLILVGGDNGYIYGSTDGLLTIDVWDAGAATTENIVRIKIAPDNPMVIFAIGENNALVKSEDGGATWFAVTGPSAGDDLLALDVVSQSQLLIGNITGEIWESEDGGETFAMQLALPDQPATSEVRDITHYTNSDVFFALVNDIGAQPTEFFIYRNENGGASGLWHLIQGGDNQRQPLHSIALCDQNGGVAGGGDGDVTGVVVQIG